MPVYGSLHVFRNASVRTGVYVGVCLALAFSGWVVVANRVPFLEPFALMRNFVAVAVMALLGAVPVLRFWRLPGNLLASSLVSWLIFTVSYRLLSFYFLGLEGRFSAIQIFMLGAVAYMLVVTLFWLWTIIRRARASDVSHTNGHPS